MVVGRDSRVGHKMQEIEADALVVGAGPAGLMAAEALAGAGRQVLLAEAMPTPARKLLMAGKSGLNLTRSEPDDAFRAAFGAGAGLLGPMLDAFGPGAVEDWARGLGAAPFTGSTGRVFPAAMKASPLLRAWLSRLAGSGVQLRTRWRWTGLSGGGLEFATPDGAVRLCPRVAVLALGGASWPRLGSDGAWVPLLAGAGAALAPLRAANAGLAVDWSAHMAAVFGQPVKGATLTCGGQVSRGEFVIAERGLEGGGLYALTPALRDGAPLVIDLLPGRAAGWIGERLARRAKDSLSSRLRRLPGMTPAKTALLQEFGRPFPAPDRLPGLIKALPVRYGELRPLDEAISTAGGITADSLDPGLMLTARPGLFLAGEMLDWEAPTGGYLLTACLATGRWAGRHAALWDAGLLQS